MALIVLPSIEASGRPSPGDCMSAEAAILQQVGGVGPIAAKIVAGVNDYIDFTVGGGGELSARIAAGVYLSVAALLAACKTAMETAAAGAIVVTTTVQADRVVVTSSTAIAIKFSTGTHAAISARALLGFGTIDTANGPTHTAAAPVPMELYAFAGGLDAANIAASAGFTNRHGGKIEVKGRPLPRFRFNGHMPVMPLDHRVCGSKTEAAPFLFRRKIGIEYLVYVFPGNSRSGVPEGDFHVCPGVQGGHNMVRENDVLDREHDLPAVRHGMDRVENKVMEDLAHLARVDVDIPDVRGRNEFRGDIGAGESKAGRFPGDVHDRSRLFDRRPSLGKREERMGEVRRPPGRLFSLRQPLLRLAPAFELSLCQADVARDGREEIVEVMGKPSRKQADRLQLLDLEELLLRPPFRRRVPEHEDHADSPALPVPDGGSAVLDDDLGPVFSDEGGVIGEADDQAAADDPFHGILAALPRLFVDDVEHLGKPPAGRLPGRPAGMLLGDPVHQGDDAVDVGDNDPVADAAQGHGKTLLLLGQPLLPFPQGPAHPVEFRGKLSDLIRGRNRHAFGKLPFPVP